MSLVYFADSYISDIDFRASDIGIDNDGLEYHGLIRDRDGEASL